MLASRYLSRRKVTLSINESLEFGDRYCWRGLGDEICGDVVGL